MTGLHERTRLPSNYKDLADGSVPSARCWSCSAWSASTASRNSAAHRVGTPMSPASRARALARYTPTPAEWASADHPARDRKAVPRRARHRRQDRHRRGSLDAGVLALCRPRHQASGAPGRWRHQGPAAVHHRSRRHRAGAERLHHGDDRDEQGKVRARPCRDPEQARQRSVRGQGGAAEGCSAGCGQSGPGAKRPALVADGAGRLASTSSRSSASTSSPSTPSARRAASIRR